MTASQGDGRSIPVARRTGAGRLKPLSRTPTATLIADQIRGLIMDGSFAPGAQLTEAELAASLEVSRGPVREAFQRLAQEGLIENYRNRGAFVRLLTDDDIGDIYLARATIEKEAMSIVMKLDRSTLDPELATLLAKMRRAANQNRWSQLADHDLAFHAAIVRGTRSTRLERMFSTLLVETRMCLNTVQSFYREPMPIVAEHDAIFEAMTAGNAEKAVELLLAHLNDALRKVVAGTTEARALSTVGIHQGGK